MHKKFRNKTAIFFIILFVSVISAPTIVISIDDSIDITFFYGDENEEEEKEGVKLLFELASDDSKNYDFDNVNSTNDGYTYKNYPKPHCNLVYPPPEVL